MTAERYTAVFTRLLSMKWTGEYPYLTMDADPRGVGDGSTLRRGRPPHEHSRLRISLMDLPDDCRRLVLDIYQEIWTP